MLGEVVGNVGKYTGGSINRVDCCITTGGGIRKTLLLGTPKSAGHGTADLHVFQIQKDPSFSPSSSSSSSSSSSLQFMKTELVYKKDVHAHGFVQAIAASFSHDGNKLAFISGAKSSSNVKLAIVDTDTFKELPQSSEFPCISEVGFQANDTMHCIQWQIDDDKRIAISGRKSTVAIFDSETATFLFHVNFHATLDGVANQFVFTPEFLWVGTSTPNFKFVVLDVSATRKSTQEKKKLMGEKLYQPKKKKANKKKKSTTKAFGSFSDDEEDEEQEGESATNQQEEEKEGVLKSTGQKGNFFPRVLGVFAGAYSSGDNVQDEVRKMKGECAAKLSTASSSSSRRGASAGSDGDFAMCTRDGLDKIDPELAQSREDLLTKAFGRSNDVMNVALSPDKKTICIGTRMCWLFLLDARPPFDLFACTYQQECSTLRGVFFHARGHNVITCGREFLFILSAKTLDVEAKIDFTSRSALGSPTPRSWKLTSCCESPDGTFIFGGTDSTPPNKNKEEEGKGEKEETFSTIFMIKSPCIENKVKERLKIFAIAAGKSYLSTALDSIYNLKVLTSLFIA